MTTSYYADRVNLYGLHQLHPDWTPSQLAQALSRSQSWVKKWRKRFREELGAGQPLHEVAQGHSCARKPPPAKTDPLIVQKILEIRDQPPEGLQRTPGPKAILYYLPRHLDLFSSALPLPRSSRTIYRILKENQRIVERRPKLHEPLERPEPMQEWQLDFKDVSTVRPDPGDPFGKQHHVVETLDVLDVGTSVLLGAQVHSAFTAQTALEAVVHTLRAYGLPASITLDRDTRWVGSPQGSDFPSALLRLLMCLGVTVQVCDPHHPQQNGFAERLHRTYQAECLQVYRPSTVEQAREVTATFEKHYNEQRPNQALSCGNVPPRTAFPVLPKLPALPEIVDPDAWLIQWDGWHIERKVDHHGCIKLDLKPYYISSKLAGHRLTLRLDASTRQVHVYHEAHLLKSVPLKGLVGKSLPFEQFVEVMVGQARAAERLQNRQERHRRTSAVVPL
jgi:transposase InsO family protein